ncbi:tail fiber assembly protein [Enterobacter cancerogenus]|nr:tail fiber assembly protein [Enterobacter cancerogenus]
MNNLGKFDKYTPDDPEFPGAMYLRNGDGTDWYSIAWDEARVIENIYAATNDDCDIVCVTDDATALVPLGLTVWEIPKSEAPSDILKQGYGASIVDGSYVINYAAKAESQRQNLLAGANSSIADWRTELQLDVISDDDKASLVKWMAYIKALKALNLSSLEDEADYNAINWPRLPSS